MVDEQIFEAEILDRLPAESTNLTAEQIELEKYKLQTRLELEKAKMEQEIWLREIRLTEIRQEPDRKGFDLAKQVRLVPKFVEANINEYFPHFEITATNMNWPRESWAMLLQTALTGKAQKAYTTLSAEDCKNYDTVKKTILQSCEMVPEAYRQKFRNQRKSENQSFMEFVKEKERLMNKWYAAKMIGEDVEKLKQLILIEEISNWVPEEMRIYLNERKINSGSELAMLADQYVITRKRNKSKPNMESRVSRPPEPIIRKDSMVNTQVTPPKKGNQITCFRCGQAGHIAIKCKLGCGPETNKAGESKPQGMVSTTLANEIYRPFTRKGNIKDGKGNNIPVTILRDTGSTQSLILVRKLPGGQPLGFTTIKGIGGKALKVPLRKVKLTTGKISREIIVGVVKTLPMKKIDLLLGNEAKIEFAQQGKNCKSEEKGQKANPYNLRRKKRNETGENIPMINKTCEELKRAQKNDESLRKLYKQVDKPITIKERPFERVIMDCIGPLPKTKSGNRYLLTIMCASSRFPEAIPL